MPTEAIAKLIKVIRKLNKPATKDFAATKRFPKLKIFSSVREAWHQRFLKTDSGLNGRRTGFERHSHHHLRSVFEAHNGLRLSLSVCLYTARIDSEDFYRGAKP